MYIALMKTFNKTTSKMPCSYTLPLKVATGSQKEFCTYSVANKYYQSVRRIYACTQPEHKDIFILFYDVTRSLLFYLFYTPATTDTMDKRTLPGLFAERHRRNTFGPSSYPLS